MLCLILCLITWQTVQCFLHDKLYYINMKYHLFTWRGRKCIAVGFFFAKYFLRDNSHSFRCFLHDMLYHRFYDTLFHCLHTSLTVTLLTLNMMVLVLLTCHVNLRDMLYHCWLTCILQAVTLFTLDMTYVSYKLTWHAVTLLFCDKLVNGQFTRQV